MKKNIKTIEQPSIILRKTRDKIIVDLHKQGFSFGQIEKIIRLERTFLWRIVNKNKPQKVTR